MIYNSSMNQKPQDKSFGTIKCLLEFGLVGLFLFGVCSMTQASIIFNDDFDDYELGNLSAPWVADGSFYGYPQIVIDEGTDKSVMFYNGTNFSFYARREGEVSTEGTMSFKIFAHSTIPAINQQLLFNIANSPETSGGILIYFTEKAGSQIEVSTMDINVEIHILGYFNFDIWKDITIQYDEELYRVKIGTGEFSDWYNNFTNITSFSYIRIWAVDVFYPGVRDLRFNIDDITGPPPECGPGNCNLCSIWQCLGFSNDCCWLLGSCIEGQCGIQGGTCGSGSNLFFCNNLIECENFDGYWYDDYCWAFEQPTEFDWLEYYEEHGEYETPSAWIDGLATTFEGFYTTFGGFLTGYQYTLFDVAQAKVKGNQLGSAIPVARGYLKVIDDFLGIAPTIDSLFIFVLLILIGVAIFSLVKGIMAVIKIW